MDNVKKHIDILGKKVEDRVTKMKGIATSVSFDLFGCVQVVLNPGQDKDGNLKETFWFDINRLKILSKESIMEVPDFNNGFIAEGKKGATEKPKKHKRN